MADRRVEITGPVDRKMVINALNSGAATYMADFEGIQPFSLAITKLDHTLDENDSNLKIDSNAPTWENNLAGQYNMRDAVRQSITFAAPNGKYYKLRDDGRLATLLVR